MSTPAIEIVAPGPLCTVQDAGRNGYQRYGVSTSGAADRDALFLGNLLLGNRPSAAALEITLGGFEARFLADCAFAITGADLTPDLDGFPSPTWEVVHVEAGQRLTMAGPGSGLRAYLCIGGGVATEPQLGSRATYLAAGLGGLDGRALQPGDQIPAAVPSELPPAGRRLPADLVPEYPAEVAVRVVPGPQDDGFTESGLDTFFGSTYTVTDRSDRQGIRFDGPEIEAVGDRYDILSDAVVTGAVQVPGDRMPIVLLADRQTTGGYPKIGVVATVDQPHLAQAAPGTAVRFNRVTVEEAQAALRAHSARLAAVEFDDASPTTTRVAVDGAEYTVELPRTGLAGRRRVRMQIGVDDTRYAVEVERAE